MAYTNYHKGRNREYKICEQLRKEGFDIVQRSASSKSCVDIWAVRYADKLIRLVQVKPKSMSDSAKKKLEEDNSRLNGFFDVEYIVL